MAGSFVSTVHADGKHEFRLSSTTFQDGAIPAHNHD
jgi:hypothetical protein